MEKQHNIDQDSIEQGQLFKYILSPLLKDCYWFSIGVKQPSMQWLSSGCQSTTVACASWQIWPWLLWPQPPLRWLHPSLLSHPLPCVHWTAPDVCVIVGFSAALHSNMWRSRRLPHGPPSALTGFVALCSHQLVTRGESNFPDDPTQRHHWPTSTSTQRVVVLTEEFRHAASQQPLGFRGEDWVNALHAIITYSILRQSLQMFMSAPYKGAATT